MSIHEAALKGLIVRHLERQGNIDIELDKVLIAIGVPAEEAQRRPLLGLRAAQILIELGYRKRKRGDRVVWRKQGEVTT